jgi:DNA recombination protein RmuC
VSLTVQLALLIGMALVVVLLLVLLGRRPEAAAGLLQQQLVELRRRLDELAAAQRALPAAVQEGARDQSAVLADVRERLGALAEATRRVEALGATVADVQQLLQVPKLRGTVGELWLEDLVRQVLPDAAVTMQYGFRSGERVDAVLRIGGRLVPVDAKFPLEACRRMLNATGADERERERRQFVRSVKGRVDEIADKYVRPDEGTFDFALMYVPAENVYYEAFVRDAAADDDTTAIGYALQRRVVPVSPHTFYAYLLVILHGLKGLEVEDRAREIIDGIGALRQQFAAFWDSYEKVGTHLGNAGRQYAEADRLRARVESGFERLASGR